MFKIVSVILVLSLLVIACDNKGRPKKPDNLITKDKMTDVLYDLYIINAAKGVNKKLLIAKGFMPETYILTKHSIDSLQFVESNKYYAFDPDLYAAIVEDVKDRLEKEKVIFEVQEKKENKETKRKRDSLNKTKLSVKDSIVKLNRKVLNKKKVKKINDINDKD